MTTTHFLTPLLNEFTDRLNAEVAKAEADIMSTLKGLTSFTVPGPSTERATGKKRTPAELANLTEDVFRLIQRNPGLRVEELAEKSGYSTSSMNLPIKKLRAEKRIAAKGVKRATTYAARGK